MSLLETALQNIAYLPTVGAMAVAAPVAVAARSPLLVTGCTALVALGVAGSAAINHYFPVAHIRPFAQIPGNVDRMAEQPYSVAMRAIPGSKSEHRPPMMVYYPTDVAPARNTASWPEWVPFGDMRYARGLCDYAAAPHIWAHMQRRNRIGATVDGPLASSVCTMLGRSKRCPVVLFSHGLSGHQTMYSALVMDLAARGAVVIAMEHGDGSACVSLQPTGEPPVPKAGETSLQTAARAEVKEVPYQPLPAPYNGSAGSADEGNRKIFEMRRVQLAHRMAEVDAIGSFIAEGRLHRALEVDAEKTKAFVDGVAAGKTTGSPLLLPFVGHSFGATTAMFAALQQKTDRAWWAPCAVPIDFWTEPVEEELPGMITASAAAYAAAPAAEKVGREFPATLWLESEGWERWGVHKAFEESIIPLWPAPSDAQAARGVSACRREFLPHTDHVGQSDAGLCVNIPGMRKPHRIGIDYDRQAIFEYTTRVWGVIQAAMPN